MTNPRILDLFCCAGGAAVGYHRAGFTPYGVDWTTKHELSQVVPPAFTEHLGLQAMDHINENLMDLEKAA